MRKATLGITVAALLVLVSAGVGWPQSNEGGLSSDVKNEKVVRGLYDDFAMAWNHHDAEALGNMWAIDGDHLEPDGTVAKGRDAVTKLLKRQHETVFKDSELDLTIDDVWFMADGHIALVDGGYQLTGAALPDGTPIPPRKGHLTAILLHESGKWWIVASRLMVPTALPYKRS
jgi:uncharacterized protein (TIGR02246 family)